MNTFPLMYLCVCGGGGWGGWLGACVRACLCVTYVHNVHVCMHACVHMCVLN